MPLYEVRLFNAEGALLLQYAADFENDDKASEVDDHIENGKFALMEISRDGEIVHALHSARKIETKL